MLIGLSNFIPFSQRSQYHFSCFHCLKTIFSCILSNFLIVYSRRPSLIPVILTWQKSNNFTLIVFQVYFCILKIYNIICNNNNYFILSNIHTTYLIILPNSLASTCRTILNNSIDIFLVVFPKGRWKAF